MYSFSQRLPVVWLQKHLSAEATHYLFPTLVQRLTRPRDAAAVAVLATAGCCQHRRTDLGPARRSA